MIRRLTAISPADRARVRSEKIRKWKAAKQKQLRTERAKRARDWKPPT